MNKLKTMSLVLGSSVVLSGCFSEEMYNKVGYASPNQLAKLNEQAKDVKWVSPKAAETCEYVDQVSVTRRVSMLGQAYAENEAKKELKRLAVTKNANGIRISDRQLDKGRGKGDNTNISFYADLYKCQPKI